MIIPVFLNGHTVLHADDNNYMEDKPQADHNTFDNEQAAKGLLVWCLTIFLDQQLHPPMSPVTYLGIPIILLLLLPH